MDDFEGVLDDADSHLLLTGVTSVEHESVDQSLSDGALSLVKSLHLVTGTGVWQIYSLVLNRLDPDVVLKGDI
jgi:hypothetical protein